jgi:hypothetical protein
MGKQTTTPKLDPLTLYLCDPIGQGVQHCRVSINRTDLDSFMSQLRSRIPQELTQEIEEESSGVDAPARRRMHRLGSELNEMADFVLRVISRPRLSSWTTQAFSELQQYVLPVLDWMAFVNGRDPVSWRPLDKSKKSTLLQTQGLFQLRRIARSKYGAFDSNLPIASTQDAVHIFTLHHRDAFILDIMSIQKQSLDRFLKFLTNLPEIGTGMQLITRSSLYSSRAVLEPYIPALSAWTEGRIAAERIPRYIVEYIQAAIGYYNQEEWRTSIVLSAIAVETLLAEIYEHEFRKEAPDIPLGALKDKLVDLFKKAGKDPAFPKTVLEWIDRTNDSRIAAVHRGSRQLSGRETLEALRGLLKVAFWYHALDAATLAEPSLVTARHAK